MCAFVVRQMVGFFDKITSLSNILQQGSDASVYTRRLAVMLIILLIRTHGFLLSKKEKVHY